MATALLSICALAPAVASAAEADRASRPTGSSQARSTLNVAVADEDVVVRTKSLAILLKVLSYDRKLAERCPQGVRIGVVARSTDSESVSQAAVTMRALASFKDKRLKGKGIGAKPLMVESAAQVESLVTSNKINTLFLSKGVEDMVKPLSRMASEKKVLLLSSEAEHVKQGAALAVVKQANNKPKILVNIDATRSQGAHLDARVLKMAEAVK